MNFIKTKQYKHYTIYRNYDEKGGNANSWGVGHDKPEDIFWKTDTLKNCKAYIDMLIRLG